MKAIETIYRRTPFKSRLEARWAVYLHTMGFTYDYEYEGYDLDEAGWYLPDFWLPHVQMWAEVKPIEFTPKELKKLKALVMFTQKPALMLVGTPDRKPYFSYCFDGCCQPHGLYLSDFALSNYHNYYRDERRFYGSLCNPGEIFSSSFDDIDIGVLAARSARFQRNDYDSRTISIPA